MFHKCATFHVFFEKGLGVRSFFVLFFRKRVCLFDGLNGESLNVFVYVCYGHFPSLWDGSDESAD